MKLRNKKTGEIVDLVEIVRLDDISDEFYLRLSDNEGRTFKVGFNSLAELNEEWEDVPEEPKEFYVVDLDGEILPSDFENKTKEKAKELGNYFLSREDAEKAVEKLKAWKRLKDKGFRFSHWVTVRENRCGKVMFKCDDIMLTFDEARQFYDDLTLVFGGEE